MSRPNIILVVLDAQRADRLSCYGCPRRTSPNLDSFAAQATVFERAIAPAQSTVPSHASMFTGYYPSAHLTKHGNFVVRPHYPTLAQLLRASGYRTVAFNSNPLLDVPEIGLQRGFDIFHRCGAIDGRVRDDSSPLLSWRDRALQAAIQTCYKAFRSLRNLIFRNESFFGGLLVNHSLNEPAMRLLTRTVKGDPQRVVRDIVEYLITHTNTRGEHPLFLFTNLMEVHHPFWPPARFLEQFSSGNSHRRKARLFIKRLNIRPSRWIVPLQKPFTAWESQAIRDAYDAEVAYQDYGLAELLDLLGASPWLEETLVIVVADHGEGLGDHDLLGHWHGVYEELVHVPFIIRYPPLFGKGQRISTVVSTRRLFHTVLDVAGIHDLSKPVGNPVDLSLARTVTDHDLEREIVFAEAFPQRLSLSVMQKCYPEILSSCRYDLPRRAAYHGTTKLIRVGDQPAELYDLSDDPNERHNRIDRWGTRAARLDELMERFVETVKQDRVAKQQTIELPDFQIDGEVLERLQGLGYM